MRGDSHYINYIDDKLYNDAELIIACHSADST